MRGEHHKVARAYVLYREERTRERAKAIAETKPAAAAAPSLHMKLTDGTLVPLDAARLDKVVREACVDLDGVSAEPVLTEARRNLNDGISLDELARAPILAARTLIESEPNYAKVSARLRRIDQGRQGVSSKLDASDDNEACDDQGSNGIRLEVAQRNEHHTDQHHSRGQHVGQEMQRIRFEGWTAGRFGHLAKRANAPEIDNDRY